VYRLIRRFKLNPKDFPRITYLIRKDCVWWAVMNDKAEEFHELLCKHDKQLQLYLCRQLRKRQRFATCVKFIRLYNLQEEAEFKEVLLQEHKHTSSTSTTSTTSTTATTATAMALTKTPVAVNEQKTKLVQPDAAASPSTATSTPTSKKAHDDAHVGGYMRMDVRKILFVNDVKTFEEAKVLY